jgi:drug/metabolite transporter (DMT)-like permease
MSIKPGLLLALLSPLLGSVSVIVYKPLMQRGVSPLMIGMLDSMTIVVCLSLFINFKSMQAITFSEKIRMWTGACAQGLGSFFSYLALNCLDPIIFSFLARNQVTISIIMGHVFLSEKHSIMTWMFFFMAFVGSMLLCYSEFTISNYIGVFFTLFACLCYSTRSYILKRFSKKNTILDIYLGTLATMLFIFIAIFITKEKPSMSPINSEMILIISITAIISTLGSSYFYVKALNYEKLSMVSTCRLFSPYFVTLFFLIFHNVHYNAINIYGFAIMSIAIVLFFRNHSAH